MVGNERRNKIIELIKGSEKPLSGGHLSKVLGVSRQIIVQDIALLRALDYNIISTSRGYLIHNLTVDIPSRVIKVFHTDSQIEDELNTVVDMGGIVVDVFIDHKLYGHFRAELNISNRREVQNLLEKLNSGKAVPLKNLTFGTHCHTITAKDESTLNLICRELDKKGYLITEEKIKS
ncbi:transcription repressor NadR [Fusobacterium sp. MFO224]|uniref:transcription repressor NadR n=1 Tax=Fusobacterium sp. MFO224 TaxID=3378070 RepID=UPI003852291A